ncbi:response regulator transcription factor [Flavobacterium psychrotrophum]|uniref:response regulator transcription factor n=1 Tax=Flavobacterium psychrotrophum TaxID=2294119 RepID=UPI000E3206AD|nr:response regulator transcription factor [Flavobacterium psychrotrophum]
MFKKILIAEDIDSVSLGLKTWLASQYPNADIRSTKYCDEALLKVKRSVAENAPFDLVISDLTFTEDHLPATIKTGEELIVLIKKLLPKSKIIVYSIYDNPQRIYNVFHNLEINAFIAKGRNSIDEFAEALNMLYTSEATFISPHLLQWVEETNHTDISDDDILLLQWLARGISQKDMSIKLQELNKSYQNIASVEKKLKRLKQMLNASSSIQLIANAKDLGII